MRMLLFFEQLFSTILEIMWYNVVTILKGGIHHE